MRAAAICSGESGLPSGGIRRPSSVELTRSKRSALVRLAGHDRSLARFEFGQRRLAAVEPQPAFGLVGPVAAVAALGQNRLHVGAEIHRRRASCICSGGRRGCQQGQAHKRESAQQALGRQSRLDACRNGDSSGVAKLILGAGDRPAGRRQKPRYSIHNRVADFPTRKSLRQHSYRPKYRH